MTTTLSPIYKNADAILSGGDLTLANNNLGVHGTARTIASASTGKRYCEATIGAVIGPEVYFGVAGGDFNVQATGIIIGNGGTVSYSFKRDGNPTPSGTALGITFDPGDVISLLTDIIGLTLSVRKNGGAWVTRSWSGIGGMGVYRRELFFGATIYQTNSSTVTFNFGATAYAYDRPADALDWGEDETLAISEGRKVVSVPIVGGTISAPGTPAYWSAVDTGASPGRLLATGPVTGMTLSSGTFDLDPIEIIQSAVPDVVFRLLAHTSMLGSAAASTTSAAIDTTGAGMLVVVANQYGLSPQMVADSKGNVWTRIAFVAEASGTHSSIFYSVPTSVGTGHTIDMPGNYGVITFFAFATAAVPGLGSVATGNSGGVDGTIASPGVGITPIENNSLIITGLSGYFVPGNTNPIAVDEDDFNVIYTKAAGPANLAGANAYLLQGLAAHVDPNWTFNVPTRWATSIASFHKARGNWNPADRTSTVFLDNGNFQAYPYLTGAGQVRGTKSNSVGKKYFEIIFDQADSTSGHGGIGLADATYALTTDISYPGYNDGKGFIFYVYPCDIKAQNYNVSTYTYNVSLAAASMVNGDVIGFAVDLDNHWGWIYKNGVLLRGDPTLGASGDPFDWGDLAQPDMYPFAQMVVGFGVKYSLNIGGPFALTTLPTGFSAWGP